MTKGAKVAAAAAALKVITEAHRTIGIGSGTTIIPFVESLAKLKEAKKLELICIPTSYQARELILQHGLPIASMNDFDQLDISFDGVDELLPNLDSIKGGGGCLMQEKIVNFAARKFYIICDSSKSSKQFGTAWKNGIPIEVLPLAVKSVIHSIKKQLGGEPKLREAVKKAGPVITDNGNFIVDWQFDATVTRNWLEVNATLEGIPGVLETGLFLNCATAAFVGHESGDVQTIERPQ